MVAEHQKQDVAAVMIWFSEHPEYLSIPSGGGGGTHHPSAMLAGFVPSQPSRAQVRAICSAEPLVIRRNSRIAWRAI
jgi:hypothetical protein